MKSKSYSANSCGYAYDNSDTVGTIRATISNDFKKVKERGEGSFKTAFLRRTKPHQSYINSSLSAVMCLCSKAFWARHILFLPNYKISFSLNVVVLIFIPSIARS
jgi:hypothetical protein